MRLCVQLESHLQWLWEQLLQCQLALNHELSLPQLFVPLNISCMPAKGRLLIKLSRQCSVKNCEAKDEDAAKALTFYTTIIANLHPVSKLTELILRIQASPHGTTTGKTIMSTGTVWRSSSNQFHQSLQAHCQTDLNINSYNIQRPSSWSTESARNGSYPGVMSSYSSLTSLTGIPSLPSWHNGI